MEPNSTDGIMIDEPFTYEVFKIIEFIIPMAISGIFSVFGVVSNAINLIVFYRQGILSHSCTVSLTALAASDFCSCLLFCWGSVCLGIQLVAVDEWSGIYHKWAVVQFYFYTSIRPCLMFSDINCGLTAVIAFERLISVTFPFKVKTIFSAKRTCVVLSCIVSGTFIYYIPNNFELILKWIWFDESNMTRLVFVRNPGISDEYIRSFIDTRVFLRASVALFVVLCNVAISLKVMLSKRFRKSAASTTTTVSQPGQDPKSVKQNGNKKDNSKKASSDESNYNESKEMKLVRMMMVVCILFGISYIVDFVFSILFNFLGWEFNVDYHYFTYMVVVNIMFLFQAINSSCNFFIYYNMSTRYREDLRMLLCNWKH